MRSFGGLLRVGMAVAVLASAAWAARADDGFFSFFRNGFGSQPQRQAAPPAAPDYGDEGAPPLVVHRHPRRHRSYAAVAARTPQEILADSRGVTLYTDKTLVRGDVVMTPHGLRMFAGSGSWPYTDSDFVAVRSDANLPPDTRKELKSIDVASRIASRN